MNNQTLHILEHRDPPTPYWAEPVVKETEKNDWLTEDPKPWRRCPQVLWMPVYRVWFASRWDTVRNGNPDTYYTDEPGWFYTEQEATYAAALLYDAKLRSSLGIQHKAATVPPLTRRESTGEGFGWGILAGIALGGQ